MLGTLNITDENALKGLPEQALKSAKQAAEQANKSGWLFTLDFPSYSLVMIYLENRELRWLMYEAFTTRATDQGRMRQMGQYADYGDILKIAMKWQTF